MKFFSLLFLILSTFSYADTKLLLIGGGKRPEAAMKLFAESSLAGPILVIPWASESTVGAANISKELAFAGAEHIEVIALKISNLEVLHQKISLAQGIFFAGGDQNKLMALINEYKVNDLLKARFKAGVIFGGTSAGTAIMSETMLTGTSSEVTIGLGLLLTGYIVDQHFIVRQRWQRLASIVSNTGLSGIGIDEDNALIVVGKKATVIGPTEVQLLQKQNGNVFTTSYVNGESFQITP